MNTRLTTHFAIASALLAALSGCSGDDNAANWCWGQREAEGKRDWRGNGEGSGGLWAGKAGPFR